jgi:hypothetical protein
VRLWGFSKTVAVLLLVVRLGVSVVNGPKGVEHMKEDVEGWKR